MSPRNTVKITVFRMRAGTFRQKDWTLNDERALGANEKKVLARDLKAAVQVFTAKGGTLHTPKVRALLREAADLQSSAKNGTRNR